MPLVNWIKTHKLISFLILVVIFLLFGNTLSSLSEISTFREPAVDLSETGVSPPSETVGTSADEVSFSLEKGSGTEATTDTSDRVVIKNSNLSLLVEDVRKVGNQILTYSKNAGGYMVSTSYTRPNESPFATITVRVPKSKLDAAIKYFSSLAIKVTSENMVGTDVTEQYKDIKARLATLAKTKTKFEEILDKATTVQDTLTVQEKIILLQDQIDALIGQRKALEQNAQLSKVTVYLSTDELALPYTPDKVFRSNVIFKQATRSLLNTLRVGGEALIWVGVYSVIWLPALGVFFVYRRWRRRKQPPTTV